MSAFVLPRFDDRALCADEDPEAWFPDSGIPLSYVQDTCADCPIRRPCAEWAIRNREWGYWGGLSEAQRNRIRENRRRGAA